MAPICRGKLLCSLNSDKTNLLRVQYVGSLYPNRFSIYRYIWGEGNVWKVKTCGTTRNPEFPRTRPDRTQSEGRGTFLRIFSGRVGNYISGQSESGIFTEVWDIFFFFRISEINLNLNWKHVFHSQTDQVEWLLSLISTLYDVKLHCRA